MGTLIHWPQEFIRRAAEAMRESRSTDLFTLARVALEASVRGTWSELHVRNYEGAHTHFWRTVAFSAERWELHVSKSLLFNSRTLILLAGAVAFGTLTPALAYPNPDTHVYMRGFEPSEPKDWDLGPTNQLVHESGGGWAAHPSHPPRPESKWSALVGGAAGVWSAINHWEPVRAGDACVFAVWVKPSGDLPNGYVSVRRQKPDGSPGELVAEHNLSGLRPTGDAAENGYQLVQVDFATGNSTNLLFYVGLWGDGTIFVDDVTILCDPLGPAEAGSGGRRDPQKGERERINNF